MAAKARKRNRYRIEDAKTQFADKLGLDPADPKIEIEAGDGTVFLIEHPLFRSKDTRDALDNIEDDDNEGIAQVIFGDQYNSYIEHGGDPDDLQFVFGEIQKDVQSVQAGRKRPTRS